MWRAWAAAPRPRAVLGACLGAWEGLRALQMRSQTGARTGVLGTAGRPLAPQSHGADTPTLVGRGGPGALVLWANSWLRL